MFFTKMICYHLKMFGRVKCMYLKNIQIKNYKGFKDQVLFDIKQITLIYGENNAGKSSVARLLPSIKKSCLQKTVGVPFYPVEINKSLPSTDFIYGNGRSFEIFLDFNILKVKYTISKVKQGLKIVNLLLKHETFGVVDIEWDDKNIYRKTATEELIIINFKGLIPENFVSVFDKDEESLNDLRLCLEDLITNIYWIAPIRYIPEPIEKLALAQSKMSPDGSEATQILAQSCNGDNLVFETVNNWFKKVFNQELTVKTLGLSKYEMFSVELSPLENGENLSVPLVSCGTGISQVLPIIVLAAQALHGKIGEKPYLIFENPELHLHDSIHSELGEYLADVIINSKFKPHIVIETHSENLLLSFQISMANKKLNDYQDEIIINWLKKVDGINLIDKVTFDKQGLLSDKWPLNAFQTTPKLARELFNTIENQE